MKNTKSIIQLVDEALASDKNDTKQTDEFLKFLRENMEKVVSKSDTTMYRFIISMTAWAFAYTSTITKISIVGAELSNLSIILIIALLVSAHAFHGFICLKMLSAAIEETLQTLYKSRFESFHEKNLTELIIYPSFQEADYALKKLQTQQNAFTKIKNWSDNFSMTIILIAPILALFVCSFLLIFYTSLSLVISIPTVLIVLFFVFLAIVTILQSGFLIG